jgi:indolepyruvate ferredoxin oxidoreductase beta subunit
VIEYLKPGVEELCSILPGVFARPLLRWSNRKNLTDKLHIGLTINSSSISGFLVLWLLARLRFVRRFSYRFREEQKLIDSWLDHVCAAGIRSNELALGIVSSARLIKGYGDTHRRGLNNYRIIEEKLIEPTLEGQITVEESILKINEAVELALSDPGGTALKS